MYEEINDLEFYSIEELINEIIKRKTFQGIIIHTEGDCKENKWRGIKDFKVHWNNNLQKHEASQILENMSHVLHQ
jgi:hypothetical protein